MFTKDDQPKHLVIWQHAVDREPPPLFYRVSIQGRLLRVMPCVRLPRAKKAVRGECRGMTHESRMRLFSFVATLDEKHFGRMSFLTLTWRDEVEPSPECVTLKRHLFWRHLEKHCGKMSALWRTEWKVRKSGRNRGMLYPHLHFAIFRAPFIPQEEISSWWQKSMRTKRAPWVWIEEATNPGKCFAYIAKYVGKEDSLRSLDCSAYLSSSLGRPWGFHRKPMIKRYSESCVWTLKSSVMTQLASCDAWPKSRGVPMMELPSRTFLRRAMTLAEVLENTKTPCKRAA